MVLRIVKREKLSNGQYRDILQANANRHFGNYFLIGIVKGKDGFPKNHWVYDDSVTLKPSTSTHKAYYGQANNQASPYANPTSATTEMTPSDYSYLQNEDGLEVVYSGYANQLNKYGSAAHRFTFDVSTYSGITNITATFKGQYALLGASTDTQFLLQISDNTGAWSTWASLTTVDTEYQKDLGDGSGYINSNIISFGIITTCKKTGTEILGYRAYAYSDYAAIQVTYSPPSGQQLFTLINQEDY